MIGRYSKNITEIWRTLFAVMMNGNQIPLFKIKVRCPDCGSWMVRTNGTKMSGKRRVESFLCKNPDCWKKRQEKGHKKARQFIVTSSGEFQEMIHGKLKGLYEDLLKDGAKHKTIAKKYGVSRSQISILKEEIIRAIEKRRKLDRLVEVPQPDRAIALDETFLKIEGKKVYIIIATGYTSRKVLGLKVSFTRTERDMREVFDEAEHNIKHLIATVSSDAWGATISMLKNLGRDITHVVHKHKKPYDKAVIKYYTYTASERIITTIGVKTDVPKTRAKRQGYYMITKESLTLPPSKKRGRPKGAKTKKKVSTLKEKKRRGRKGLFKVFDTGKKFFFKVDPYRKTIKRSKDLPASVGTALAEVLRLFALKSIQNNVSENMNFVLRALLKLCGPKTIESIEQRIRAFILIRNNPEHLSQVQIDRNLRGTFLLNNLKVMDLPALENGVIST